MPHPRRGQENEGGDYEQITSGIHLVDLAGSILSSVLLAPTEEEWSSSKITTAKEWNTGHCHMYAIESLPSEAYDRVKSTVVNSKLATSASCEASTFCSSTIARLPLTAGLVM